MVQCCVQLIGQPLAKYLVLWPVVSRYRSQSNYHNTYLISTIYLKFWTKPTTKTKSRLMSSHQPEWSVGRRSSQRDPPGQWGHGHTTRGHPRPSSADPNQGPRQGPEPRDPSADVTGPEKRGPGGPQQPRPVPEVSSVSSSCAAWICDIYPRRWILYCFYHGVLFVSSRICICVVTIFDQWNGNFKMEYFIATSNVFNDNVPCAFVLLKVFNNCKNKAQVYFLTKGHELFFLN